MYIKKIPTGIIIISIILTMLLMLEVTAGNAGVESIEKGILQDLDTNTTRVIIGFKDNSLDKQQIGQYQDNLINKYGGKRIINEIDKLDCIIIELEERTKKQEFIQQIIANEHKNIKYVEPDHIVTITHTPNDSLYPYQWGPQAIQSEYAWDTQRGNSNLTIAIIDTGIDYTHEDLENYVSGGYDWVNDDNDPMDDHGHGTHCAGIATAKIDNNKGVAGIAQVSVMGFKVLSASGSGWTSDVAAGIINATDQGADIISLSLGSTSFSSAMQDACQYAWDSGCVIIAASGNKNKSIIYPAKYDTVIAVGAINSNNERCNNTDWGTGRGSNYGPELELIAPGDNILSTVPGFVNLTGYESWRGTSMAAPHVTGVAALVWSNCPGFTNSELREQLIYTADDLGDKGWDQYYGWGRVDAEKAINCNAASCIEVEPGSFDPEILENGTRDYILTLENTGTKIGLFETYVVPDEIYFTDDMESGINGWTHGGYMDEWELGNPVYGPFSAHSGVNCWGTDLDNTYEYTADAWLVSPVTDLGEVDQANLSFWQWHELLNDDACYIEISIDNGSNWIELKKYSDNEITWSKEDINITAYTGSDETRIRFRLESDWFDNRAGLYIDDIQIYRPCDWLFEDTILGVVYPQKSENITITCDVAGLDTGTYNGSVVVTYGSQECVEIPVNLDVLPGGEPDIRIDLLSYDIMVGQGLVKETDLTIANDGTGVLWLYNITDTVNTGPDWLTESPDKCRVYADESVNITLIFDATQLDTGDYNAIISITNSDPYENFINVSVNMTILPPDIWVESTLFDVEVPLNVETVKAFTIGNDGPGLLKFNITDTSGTILLEDDMESGPGEWTHGGDEDEWEYGTPVCGPENAYSGDNCWGTDLDNTYENHTDQWLMTPSMDLSNIDSAILSFHLWYATESPFDVCYVEISTTGAAGTWIELAEYSGCKEMWITGNPDISMYTGNSDVRIRFRLKSDNVANYAGMYIDDVAVVGNDWISEGMDSGSIQPGEVANVEITIGEREPGTYNESIIIESNDPDENPKVVLVNVKVLASDIQVEYDDFNLMLDTGEMWNGTFKIGNDGAGILWYEIPDAMLLESFENDALFPKGWKRIQNSSKTWEIVSHPAYVHSGDYAALCNYVVGNKQNEWLISKPLNMTAWKDTRLSFWWKSSYYWMVDPYNNFDVFVKVSTDGGNMWDTVWTSGEIGEFSNFQWYDTSFQTPVDLSAYEGNSSVLIAWNLVGEDTAEFVLDDIVVTTCSMDCSWIEMSPNTDIISSGNHTNITVNIDTTGLSSGSHNANIVIVHNDPAEGLVLLPVNVTINALYGCVGATKTFPCGSTVTESCVLNCDMNCPSGSCGLKAGSNDIVIDGAGHSITGTKDLTVCNGFSGYNPATHSGIINTGNFDNVMIKNLEVENFCTGIALGDLDHVNVDNNTVENCMIHDNGHNLGGSQVTHGIHMVSVNNCSIINNTVFNNCGTGTGCNDGGNGIFIRGGTVERGNYNNIINNSLFNNSKSGFFMTMKCMHNFIGNNTVTDNSEHGITLRCKSSNYNTLESNNASENLRDGIFIGGSNNSITYNTVLNNEYCGIDIARSDGSYYNELYENIVCGNENTDIFVVNEVPGNHGDSNICNITYNYNDDGTTGCTFFCEGAQITQHNATSPIVISGWVSSSNGDPVYNPDVTVTNLNTGEIRHAQAYMISNYYRIMMVSDNVSAGDMLNFSISDNTSSIHTIIQDDINNGGFEYNFTTGQQTGLCGDVTGNGVVDTGNVILLSNYVGYYPGNPNYALNSTAQWAGDVTGNDVIDTGDVILLSNYVGYQGYSLNCKLI